VVGVCQYRGRENKYLENLKTVNKFLSLSVIPLAATATVASVMVASAPAQALSFWSGTLAQFKEAPVTVGDKEFTYTNSAELSDNDTVKIQRSGLQYFFDYEFASAFTGDAFTLGYTVQVTAPGYKISAVDLDSDVSRLGDPEPLKVLTTDFNTTKLVSTNGSSAVAPLNPFSDFVTVSNNYVSEPGGIIFDYQNSFEQVPEPLTILGTGLALGFGGLFKSKSSKKQSVKA
jgi:hypothetical protein